MRYDLRKPQPKFDDFLTGLPTEKHILTAVACKGIDEIKWVGEEQCRWILLAMERLLDDIYKHKPKPVTKPKPPRLRKASRR